jgi:4-methyl-5(b-hydroxyethyl)-thiazole monophosphate biosynthesis
MAKKVLVLLAEGFEEIEAVTPIDVLRRAGVDVVVAGVTGRIVSGAHGLKFETDLELRDFHGAPDLVVLPGGMPGAKNLGESREVQELVKRMHREKRWIGAICAAPALALAPAGILEGRKATCYPGFEKEFKKGTTFSQDRVVVDGNVVTSRGPGSALEFSLELARRLVGDAVADELQQGMLAKV